MNVHVLKSRDEHHWWKFIVANGFNYGMPMWLFILPSIIGDGSLIFGNIGNSTILQGILGDRRGNSAQPGKLQGI